MYGALSMGKLSQTCGNPLSGVGAVWSTHHKSTKNVWVGRIRIWAGRTPVIDESPSTYCTKEHIQSVGVLIGEDRRITLAIVCISYGSAQATVNDNLGHCNVSAPRVLKRASGADARGEQPKRKGRRSSLNEYQKCITVQMGIISKRRKHLFFITGNKGVEWKVPTFFCLTSYIKHSGSVSIYWNIW